MSDQPTKDLPAFVFDGFEPANTTPVPDVLFDELLSELAGTELKVLLYIIRRTLGFKKTSDGISLSQFTDGIKTKDGKILDKGCGIKKRSTVSKALRELLKKGCIESEKGKTDLGDDAVTVYRVRFKGVVPIQPLPGGQNGTTVVPKETPPGSGQNGTRGSADSATHKKQLTRNSNQQETELQEGTFPRESATVTSGADAPTRTLENTAYRPDPSSESATAQETIERINDVLPQVEDELELRRASGALPAQAELSTAGASSAQGRGKVAGEKPTRGSRSKKAEPVVEFSPEGRSVHEAWCKLFRSPPRAAEKTIECANELASRLIPWCKELKMSCKDMLDEIRKWEYATDPDYYRKRGVTLCDIGRDFERWQSAKTHELEQAMQAEKPARTISGRQRLDAVR